MAGTSRLCIYGIFDSSEFYSRNSVLARELSANFAEVRHVQPKRQSDNHQSNRDRLSSVANILATAWRMLGDLLSLWRQRKAAEGADVYFVPYPAYFPVHCLRYTVRGAKNAPVIVDAFLCLHDTVVEDRGMAQRNGLVSRILRVIERKALIAADLVLIDTESQRRRLIADYALDPAKILAVPVGIDESVWSPQASRPLEEPLRLLFWGTFIPLHGVEVVLSAARLLDEQSAPVHFTIVGEGQMADAFAAELVRKPPSNMTWERRLLPARVLAAKVTECHCVLGIFGDTQKASEVVPYKAYQAMASNRILITRDGAAIRDLVNGDVPDGLILVPPGQPQALAEAILNVLDNYAQLSLQPGTRKLYDSQLSCAIIRSCLRRAVIDL